MTAKILAFKDAFLLIVAISVVLFAISWGWHWYREHGAPVEKSLPAIIAWEVAHQPHELADMKAPPEVIAGGKRVKENLNLPASVVQQDSKKVTGAATTKADGHRHTITSVLDTSTGKTTMYDRVDPLPWFQFLTSGRVGAYYGTNDQGAAAMLLLEQDLLQVKALRLGVIGTVTQPTGMNAGQLSTHGFIGIGGRIEW